MRLLHSHSFAIQNLLILCLIVGGFACNTESRKARKANFQSSILELSVISNELPKRQINLSEIMKVEFIVPLETGLDFILSSDEFINQYAVTNSYILATSGDAIYQFTIHGKYVRTLVKRGNGPEEFIGLNGFTVDPDREILYYSHSGDLRHLVVIDLNTGSHLSKIALPLTELGLEDGLYMADLEMGENQTIICTPSVTFSSTNIFRIDLNGELLNKVKNYETTDFEHWKSGRAFSRIQEVNYYKEPDNDTIYLLDSWHVEPYAIVSISDDYERSINVSRTLKGYGTYRPNEVRWNLRLVNSSYVIVLCEANYCCINGGPYLLNNSAINIDRRRIYIPFDSIEEPFILENIFVDTLGYEVKKDRITVGEFDYNFPLSRSGDKLILKIDAFDFKDQVQEMLKTSSSDILPKSLVELNRQISEEDNPILIIGSIF